MKGPYGSASEQAKGLFRVVVLDILARMGKGTYRQEVKVMLGLNDKEKQMKSYLEIAKCCDLAFIKVVLELHIVEMLNCKLNDEPLPMLDPQNEDDEDDEEGGGGRKKKRAGRKAGEDTLEVKEGDYADYVQELQNQQKAPKDETSEAKEERLSWYVGAIDILTKDAEKRKKEREERKKKREAEEGSKENSGAGDGQRAGEAVAKKKKRKITPRVMPNDGYQGYVVET